MSEEDNLIEELKRSLKITENEYLESEIEDLKEFFTVQTRRETDYAITDNNWDEKCFWLEVFLPVTLRKITKEGKEVLDNEKPMISFKIKLKNGKCFPIELNPVEAEEEEVEKVEATDITMATETTETIETTVIDGATEAILTIETSSSVDTTDNVIGSDVTASTTSISSTTTSFVTAESVDDIVNSVNTCTSAVDELLPYEIIEVKVSEIEETVTSELCEIFESLIHPNDLSLLNVIEEFYIKLEEKNYPNKTVICRDYYYPVFDNRHWGRSQSPNKSQSPSDNSSPISYRARALYDFQALMQGELSFQENEILIVLANLGNGWLTARRTSTSTTSVNETGDDTITGLIPENYIERL